MDRYLWILKPKIKVFSENIRWKTRLRNENFKLDFNNIQGIISFVFSQENNNKNLVQLQEIFFQSYFFTSIKISSHQFLMEVF